MTGERGSRSAPIVAGPGLAADRRRGNVPAVHEWTESGSSYLHVHRSDDEAWHVLEGALRSRLGDRGGRRSRRHHRLCPPARRTPTATPSPAAT